MIIRADIPKEVLEIADRLESAGFEAYLVGGCVRDLMIGKKPKDWDLTTDAHPEPIQELFPESFHNNDFGTVGVKNPIRSDEASSTSNGTSEETEDETLRVIEVTPYRTEGKYSDARRPDHVEFGVTLEEDLKRRDFTVNAMAWRPSDEKLVDLFGGTEDIKKKRLKTVGNPDERFGEDALRMMRAVRLSAQLNFAIEGETMTSIIKNHEHLSRISVERIADEFCRLLMSDTPMQGIAVMERLGLLDYVLPELKEGIGCEQGGTHAYDVFEHNLRTCQAAADKDYPLHMRLAALLHDIAKPRTRGKGKHKEYSFYGHEVVGAKMAKNILKNLKIPRELTEKVVNLVRWHMFFADPDEVTLAAVRRTIVRIGEENIEDLLNLRVCDRIGTGRPKEQPFRFRKYKAMVDEARRDPISVKMLKINGDIIMEKYGEKPGKRLGYTLHALLEEVLIDPKKNTEDYLHNRTTELLKLSDAELQKLGEAGKEKQKEEEEAAVKEIKKSHKVV